MEQPDDHYSCFIMLRSEKVERVAILMTDICKYCKNPGTGRANGNIIVCMKYNVMMLCHTVFIKCDSRLCSYILLDIYSFFKWQVYLLFLGSIHSEWLCCLSYNSVYGFNWLCHWDPISKTTSTKCFQGEFVIVLIVLNLFLFSLLLFLSVQSSIRWYLYFVKA